MIEFDKEMSEKRGNFSRLDQAIKSMTKAEKVWMAISTSKIKIFLGNLIRMLSRLM